jgi:eukaryotic-like serine/threonine-protein kinase
MKSAFWKTDWFLGTVVVLAVLFFNRFSDLVPSLERKAYDLGVQATSRSASDKIAVIAIDDTSIRNIGRWPWSREVHAKMTDLLAGAKAKVVVNTVFFSEPQVDAGYGYVTKLLELPAAKNEPLSAEMAPVVALLKDAEQQLNTDRKLAESYTKAGNVLLPILFELGQPLGKPDRPLPDFTLRNAVKAQGSEATSPLQAMAV